MIFHISISLKTGKFLNGSQEWPVHAGFKGNLDTQAFYLQMKDQKTLDAGTLLNDIMGETGTGILEHCRVEDLGVFFLNMPPDPQDAENAVYHLLDTIDSKLCTSVSVLTKGSELVKGKCICVWLIADLYDIEVFSSLLKIGYNGGSRLALLGCFCKRTPNRLDSYFYAALPSIQLLKIFHFEDVKLKYQLTDTKYFALSGQIGLCIEETAFVFRGDLVLDDVGYRAALENVGPLDILRPFTGRVDELCFDKIRFQMECTYQTAHLVEQHTYYLSASVTFAQIKTSGQIYFQDGNIILAQVQLDSGFSLAALWGVLFPSFIWDADVFDLKFLTGTRFYYCSAPDKLMFPDSGNASYQKGYGVLLYAEITLIATLALNGSLTVTDEALEAALIFPAPLNLSILKICGNDMEHSPEFTFSFHKNSPLKEKTAKIQGSLCFFGTDLGTGTVEYTSTVNDWSLRAKLLLPEFMQSIFGKTLTVIYSKSTGFKLENLEEVPFYNEALNFIKRLEQYIEAANKGGKCKALSIKGEKNKLHLKFRFKPAIKGTLGGNGSEQSVTLGLTGSLLILDQAQKTILSRELPSDINITIGKDLSFQNLYDQVVDILAGVLDSLISFLFDDSHFEDLEKILEILVIDQLEDYAAGLLCRKLVNEKNVSKLLEKVKPGTQPGTEPGTEPEPEPGTEPSGGSGGSGGGSGGGAAAGGAGAGGAGAGGAGAGGAGAGGAAAGGAAAGGAGAGGSSSGGSGSGGSAPGGTTGEEEKLSCPQFHANIREAFLELTIEKVDDAVGYQLHLIWDFGERREDILNIDASQKMPVSFSLLDIPVYGKLYLQVKAIHQKEALSSNWSDQIYLYEITHSLIICWACHAGYCIRDCYEALKKHNVDIGDYSILKKVLEFYDRPDTKEDIARQHFSSGDSASVCLAHIDKALPHLSCLDIMDCMWHAGYQEEEIKSALLELRAGLTHEDVDGLLGKILHKGENT